MDRILVSGLINIETTLRVDTFPLNYEPVRYPFFGIKSTVCGVGYNVASALLTLGNEVDFLSIIGRDTAGDAVRLALAQDGLVDEFIIDTMPYTAQSVIIYDANGRRQIHTDLKDIQDRDYPPDLFKKALHRCALAALCNINYNRPLLAIARKSGVPIATDVHTIADIEDAYNRDFMAAATILFLSDELLPCAPEEFVRQLQDRYQTPVIVIGLGGKGALLAVQKDEFIGRMPAVSMRPVINSIGAGDALFSSFIHGYRQSGNPYLALRKAIVFASYKIGESGAAEGFLNGRELEDLYQKESPLGSIEKV
jgi:sugar/nucleoside kinase (ribokinase family)